MTMCEECDLEMQQGETLDGRPTLSCDSCGWSEDLITQQEDAPVNKPAEPAVLPQSLVDAATEAVLNTRHSGWETQPRAAKTAIQNQVMADATAALQAACVPALLQELRNIAFNCKDCDADDYRDWARSRARHTLRQVLGDDYKEAA